MATNNSVNARASGVQIFNSTTGVFSGVTLAKGSLLTFNGTSSVYAALSVGTDGQGLVADSTQALGIKWGSVGGASLSPYIVGATLSDYTTIAAAISAATTAGASATNPINVYIKPKGSDYSENLTLANGVNLIGLGSVSYYNGTIDSYVVKCSVTITGTHTSPASSDRVCKIEGINLSVGNSYMFTFGSGSSYINLVDCCVSCGSGGIGTVIRTLSGADAHLIASGCRFVANSGAQAGWFTNSNVNASTMGITIDITNCYLEFSDTDCARTGLLTLNITDCNILFNTMNFTSGWGLSMSVVGSVWKDFGSPEVQVADVFTVDIVNSEIFCSLQSNNSGGGLGILTAKDSYFTYPADDFTSVELQGCTNTSAYTKVLTVTSGYNITQFDQMICADTTSSAFTLNLPDTPYPGQTHIIKDLAGTAATNNITVAGNAINIDGSSTFVIISNYAAFTFVFNGITWSII